MQKLIIMRIGKKIRQLREKKKVTQAELSEFLNISQSALCNLESEKSKKVDFYVIYGICEFFNINFNSFLKEKHFKGFGKDGRKEGRKKEKFHVKIYL